MANGMGTSCGWRNRDRARLGSRSPSASVCLQDSRDCCPWAVCGTMRDGTWLIWSMKAEPVSLFSLSDSKGSLEPHKPGKCPAEIAALTYLPNISN